MNNLVEIERKFLVDMDLLTGPRGCGANTNGTPIEQGYIGQHRSFWTTRVRVARHKAYLTVKGPKIGNSGFEAEYEIPVSDAKALLAQACEKTIKKIRYNIPHEGHVWELDIFEGENEGLAVVEIELMHSSDDYDIPEWCTKDVTGETKYYNSNLIDEPYQDWP
jgi:adenylate cyclase